MPPAEPAAPPLPPRAPPAEPPVPPCPPNRAATAGGPGDTAPEAGRSTRETAPTTSATCRAGHAASCARAPGRAAPSSTARPPGHLAVPPCPPAPPPPEPPVPGPPGLLPQPKTTSRIEAVGIELRRIRCGTLPDLQPGVKRGSGPATWKARTQHRSAADDATAVRLARARGVAGNFCDPTGNRSGSKRHQTPLGDGRLEGGKRCGATGGDAPM